VYLKRLELLGFKSFPDKTIVKLTRSVTAIVGPNGCGKTNILDSIRWVLGEQRVSLLRGTKMEEVIFNGTRDIKPLGMSEVTLVIQNNRGILPTEYNEVQITRRLFRSGESEYLLNKVPCRLKDIADLLMDTGIGAHVYSVIQQDMIDAILSDRTDDRRFLFEEAAGISKYKNRKKAALRKLEATEQDLTRLKDILAEINSQVISLSRQMKRAERYQKMTEEIKAWEIFLNKETLNHLKSERQEKTVQRDQALDARAGFDAAIDTLTARQEEERRQLSEIDRRLSQISAEVYEKSEAAHALENQISVIRAKRDHARESRERNILDIEALKRRKESLLLQITDYESQIQETLKEIERGQTQLAEVESLAGDADTRLLDARKAKEELAQRLLNLESRLSAGKSDDTNLKELESDLSQRLAILAQNLELTRSRGSELKSRLDHTSGGTAEQETQLASLLARKTELEKSIADLLEQSETMSGELVELTANLEASEARKKLLHDMITHFEGYGSGVVAAFENRALWPELLGTVADYLAPHAGFEDALDAALGDMAGYLICRDRHTAHQIIDYLKREKKGKAGIIITGEISASLEIKRPEINSEGFIGWADQFVSAPEHLTGLTRLLLGRVVVCRPESADLIAAALPPFLFAVTTDGRLLNGTYLLSGGSFEGLSLLGRKDKIRVEDEAIASYASRLASLRGSRSELTTALGRNQGDLKETLSEIELCQEKISEFRRQIAQLEAEAIAVNNEIIRVESESAHLSERLAALRTRQYDLTLNYDHLESEKSTLLSAITAEDARISEYEKEAEKMQSRMSGLQINLIELKSKQRQLETQLQHTRELIEEIDNALNTKSSEIETAAADFEETGAQIVMLETQLKTIFDERNQISARQIEIREQHSALLENIGSREKEIKTHRQSREESLDRLHKLELRLTEIDSECRNIIDKVLNEHDMNIEYETPANPDPSVAPELQLPKLHELKDAVKAYGAVNLLALDEYRVAKERQEFLTAQMNDLLNAKSTLQSTITKINTTAKNLFVETLGKVRENFRKVFEELFTGGEADVRLVDENDPLESPIEIIARPRGKKLLSIAQMSGGERALTAISLLFAIYLVKPSPFCILDEIDAPLDDANIHRFLKMIKAFSDQTQFIIITHNKITMEAADVLYGVTMEQPGVSRVVSVRFSEEPEKSLINTSISDLEPDIPESIQERISSDVKIKTADSELN